MFTIKQTNIISSSFSNYIQFINKRTFQNIIKQHQTNKKEPNINPMYLFLFFMCEKLLLKNDI
jgi:hypothetical protein